MANEKMKMIGDRFIVREHYANEEEFQKAVSKVEQDFRKRYFGYQVEAEDVKLGVLILIRDSPQTAERRKVIEKLFSELKDVPNWRTFSKNITAEELEQCYDAIFAKKVNFDYVWNYIQEKKEGLQLTEYEVLKKGLLLKETEVLTGLWFPLILFGIYGRERFEFWDWSDKTIFDVSDDKTTQKLESIEELMKLRRNGLLTNVRKQYFFERIVEIRDFLGLLEKTDF